jgi:signal transduction histidine kinase
MKAPAEAHAPLETLELLGVDAPVRLEELVDKNALRELVDSWARIFGVEIRVSSTSGGLLAGSAAPGPILPLLGDRGAAMAAEAFRAGPSRDVRTSATGEQYRVVAVDYERRATGVLAIGPFVLIGDDAPESGLASRSKPSAQTAALAEPPAELLALAGDGDRAAVAAAWARVPRFSQGRMDEIASHLGTVLEVMLFSGHKALVTSQMHLASVQESYRELTEKNASLEDAYSRLKELDRLKSNFLATVSHELRTPLTSIMGYGEMLAVGLAGELNPEQKDFVETIRTKSDQLLGLIMSLLDLSKLESGTMPVRVARTSMGSVLGDAVSTLRPTAMKKGVTLDVDAPDSLPPVLGDVDRLRQVFINLTENAIKFTPAGGTVRLDARLTTVRVANEPGLVLVAPLRPVIEVRVSDTGVGVPEHERERIFDPFYQIDQTSTREHGGAGLGLAIVKRLVDAHQGTIHVEGNDPHGAVFVVAIPSGRTSLPPSRGPSSGPPAGSSEGSIPPIFG